MTAGKILSPKIPNAMFSDQETTRRSVLGYMQHGMMHDIFDALGDITLPKTIFYT